MARMATSAAARAISRRTTGGSVAGGEPPRPVPAWLLDADVAQEALDVEPLLLGPRQELVGPFGIGGDALPPAKHQRQGEAGPPVAQLGGPFVPADRLRPALRKPA